MFVMPISGLLCEHGFAGGWPSVFYVFGTSLSRLYVSPFFSHVGLLQSVKVFQLSAGFDSDYRTEAY